MAILEDERTIHEVWQEARVDAYDPAGARVGYKGVTKIIAYAEIGLNGCPIPCFEVWKGDFLFKRLNGQNIAEITYQDERDDDGKRQSAADDDGCAV